MSLAILNDYNRITARQKKQNGKPKKKEKRGVSLALSNAGIDIRCIDFAAYFGLEPKEVQNMLRRHTDEFEYLTFRYKQENNIETSH